MRFAPSNRYGVLDHDVTLPDADTAAVEADLATLTRLLEPGPGQVADG